MKLNFQLSHQVWCLMTGVPYTRPCAAFQAWVTVMFIILPCYWKITITIAALTLIQDCERHRYLQSNYILCDNIPIESYSEALRRAEKKSLFVEKRGRERAFQVKNKKKMKCWFLVASIRQQTAASLCSSQTQTRCYSLRHKGFLVGSTRFPIKK